MKNFKKIIYGNGEQETGKAALQLQAIGEPWRGGKEVPWLNVSYVWLESDGWRYYRKRGSLNPVYSIRDGSISLAEYTGTTGGVTWNIVLPDGTPMGHKPFSSGKSFYYRDHLGSTRTVVYENGTIQQVLDYYPFGLEMSGRGMVSGSPVLQRFTGYERTSESMLDYAGARWYNPRLGRFWSVDPMAGEFPAWSPCNYGLNDPLRYVDPDGRAARGSDCCNFTFQRVVGDFFNFSVNRTLAPVQAFNSQVSGYAQEYLTNEMIQTGMQLTHYGINQADADMTLVGIQMVLDGTADVAGRIETVSAFGLLSPKSAPVSFPVFSTSSSIANSADIGATGIEWLRFGMGNARINSVLNRSVWTGLNNLIPGRVSSNFQGREEAARGLTGEGLKQTKSILNNYEVQE